MAVALIGMYVVGTYMVDLEYYDRLYHTLPALHKATGVVLGWLVAGAVGVGLFPATPITAAAMRPRFTHLAGKLGHVAHVWLTDHAW